MLPLALLFVSCENFLDSKNLQNQIEKQIEYYNSNQYTIIVDAPKNSGIVIKPAGGEAKVKPTDVFNLSFNSESDSQFLKWEVYNYITDEALTDNPYLNIENPLMIDTTCTYVKEPDDKNIYLAIRAVTAKRPRIIRVTPVDQETGVPRNSTVRIMFDKFNMESDCLYYTTEEMQELKTRLGLQDSDFLQGDDTNCSSKYYGYKKGDKRYFKNIEIVSSPVSGSYLTKYFYDPYWEKEPNDMGGSTLVIQTTNPPPPKNVIVYITLSKDFYCLEDSVPVTLREANTISYKTMYDNEDKYPEFFVPKDSQDNNDYNIVKFKNENGEYENLPYNKDRYTVPNIMPECKSQQYFYLKFCFSANDQGGSGISNSFRLCCENPDLSDGETFAPPIELPYVNYTAEEGFVDWSEEYIIPRTKYLKSNKKYCFRLEVVDNDGNETVLKDDNGDRFYYWLNLSQTAVIY